MVLGHKKIWSCLEDSLSGFFICCLSFKQKGTVAWKMRPPSWSFWVLRQFILGCNVIKLIDLDLLFVLPKVQSLYNLWSPVNNHFLIFPSDQLTVLRITVCPPKVVYNGIISLKMTLKNNNGVFHFLCNSPEVNWLSLLLLGILCQRIYLKSPWRWRENCTVKRADAWAGKGSRSPSPSPSSV